MNDVRAVFIAFVYLAQRLIERNAIVPLSSGRHCLEQRGLHDGESIIGHASVLRAPKIAECRLPRLDPCIGKWQQPFRLHGEIAPEFTDRLDGIAVSGRLGANSPRLERLVVNRLSAGQRRSLAAVGLGLALPCLTPRLRALPIAAAGKIRAANAIQADRRRLWHLQGLLSQRRVGSQRRRGIALQLRGQVALIAAFPFKHRLDFLLVAMRQRQRRGRQIIRLHSLLILGAAFRIVLIGQFRQRIGDPLLLELIEAMTEFEHIIGKPADGV
jgi:hypothetical protein